MSTMRMNAGAPVTLTRLSRQRTNVARTRFYLANARLAESQQGPYHQGTTNDAIKSGVITSIVRAERAAETLDTEEIKWP